MLADKTEKILVCKFIFYWIKTRFSGIFARPWGKNERLQELFKNQRTSGPVNAHLISWPSKAQDMQNLENIW